MIPSLLEAALRSVLLALTVWAAMRAFRVRNVLTLKIVWGLVLAAAVSMPMLLPLASRLPALPTFMLPAHPLKFLAAAPSKPQATDAAPITYDSGLASGENASDRYPAPTVSSNASSVPVQAAHSQRLISLPDIGWLLYFAVAVALIFRLIFGVASAIRLWNEALPATIDGVAPLADGLHLRSSETVSSPVTIGSAVVLPADYKTWETEKLRIVLAHERSHIRQGDFYLQILAALYVALFWFSPLGWWLKRKLSDLAEAISDRAGLEQAASPSAYAQILLEFAADPRPTLIGVAMARPGSLSRRIERLLNDNAFRQSFAATRRLALVAVLLVPIALITATTLIRVEAAGQTQPVPPVAPAAPTTGVSNPVQPSDVAEPAAVPGMQPAPESVTAAPPAPVGPESSPDVVPPLPPAPPSSAGVGEGVGIGIGQDSTTSNSSENHNSSSRHSGWSHSSYWSDSNYYAIVNGSWDNLGCCGWMNDRREEFEKARKLAHGDFLWFNHDGKDYYIDDPAVVSQLEAAYKPIEELGKQQEELGRQQEELGKQQEALGKQQEEVSVPTPDMSKEIAEIDEAMAKLKADQGKPMDQKAFADMERKLGDLQGKLGQLQGQVGAKQGEFGRKMGELGSKQGELGARQGRLGAEQGRLSREADAKVRSAIDQGLANGTAHPVQ